MLAEQDSRAFCVPIESERRSKSLFGRASFTDNRSHLSAKRSKDPFSSLVRRSGQNQKTETSDVHRFETASKNRVFLFEQRGNQGLIRFLCSPDDPRLVCALDDDYPAEEIITLTATRATRGDILYKNELGQAVLRVTPYGNATVYWPGEKIGSAATKTFSADPPLRLLPMGQHAYLKRSQKATALVSAIVGKPIIFETASYVDDMQDKPLLRPQPNRSNSPPLPDGLSDPEQASADDSGLVANPVTADFAVQAAALARAAEAIAHLANDPLIRKKLAKRISTVRIKTGSTPDIALDNDCLTITVTPDNDINGRPSSITIQGFLTNGS
ncbi:MAG: DUF4908 domain-containing protein [Pseudomonadota bacterium]